MSETLEPDPSQGVLPQPATGPPGPEPGPEPPASPPQAAPATPGEADPSVPRNWAAACHLAALCGYASVPLGFFLGPLIVWAVRRDRYPLVDDQGKEAVNFQLSVLLYTLACIPLICVCVGIVLLVLLAVLQFVLIIVAAVRASSGERYRYPFTIRFLK